MARFAQVAKGGLARQRVEVALIDGTTWAVDVVPLIGEHEADVLVGARAFAKARGVEEPKAGVELYELGLWVHTLLVACLDPDEPTKAVRAFDSVEQMLDRTTGLDRDRIAFLFEAQQRHQDACSFRKRGLSMAEYIQAVVEHAVAEEDPAALPFEQWQPATRRSFVRFLAHQVTLLWNLKSPSGPGLPDEPTNSTSSLTSAPGA
jgi:hypothetical protein